MRKVDYTIAFDTKLNALQNVCSQLGADHPITVVIGKELQYGKAMCQLDVDAQLSRVTYAVGYLDGVADTAIRAASILYPDTVALIKATYPFAVKRGKSKPNVNQTELNL
jgi:hypothetical protein